ncbi:MAG TPA: FAD:protein FMN transferase [Ktedonobacteraceae bacterium]|nr:FAD:protein FMN transferase [Ktedonobacteraceae bacterium]
MGSDQAATPSHQAEQASPEMFLEYSAPEGMVSGRFKAMGTTIMTLLPEAQADALEIVRSLFDEWEQALSRFLPESELSWLNEHPGQNVITSPLLFRVLISALNAAQATQGIYDPTLLDQIKQIGYDRSFDSLSPTLPAASYEGQPGGGWHGIQVSPLLRSVRLPEGVKLDFGGIAKGMAVDAALVALQEAGIERAMVNAGGDLAVIGVPPTLEDWPIAVPVKDECRTLPLRSGAMATSGISRRHWKQGTSERHHLLDPRTGLPAESDLWSVTATAERCEQAEVAAKVAFVLGMERGKAFLTQHKLSALLVGKDGRWGATGYWPVDMMQ